MTRRFKRLAGRLPQIKTDIYVGEDKVTGIQTSLDSEGALAGVTGSCSTIRGEHRARGRTVQGGDRIAFFPWIGLTTHASIKSSSRLMTYIMVEELDSEGDTRIL